MSTNNTKYSDLLFGQQTGNIKSNININITYVNIYLGKHFTIIH